MKKFNKEQRATWKYFWAHWFAFQMTATVLGVWKFKYLFHDWYKPWLKMFGIPYYKIQKYHRTHSNHHLEWLDNHNPNEIDWIALIIDWECSRFTKESSPRTAREEMNNVMLNATDSYLIWVLQTYMEPKLKLLNL